ncbi:MAG: hypothetical protein COS58_00150 [Candidatus Tagabacteria bacterium CG03_land_8_20_14_0_80_41_22]|uniref:Cell shape-determining protein MreC n=1 Tax=Candidatus Tagabacteria bacterium CG03_land_8_20_14_0_80_41_22 TaxID=1975020 RepID=A0A2M7B9L7_9BACT|nr:MAG: hypothetical protein COS58_00150 [Candidatus Tagabacteria bacterium CG03_land_8_20_14_0_80_41_22]
MRTTYRPNINRRKSRKLILSGALTALILIVIVFGDFSFGIIDKPIMYIIRPFFGIKNVFGPWWQNLRIEFYEKKSLQEENEILREKIIEMETKIIRSEILEKENVILKNAFSAGEKQNFLLASIIFRPSITPYDIFIIDSGSDNGVKEGMQVSAFGNVLLGYVADLFSDTSKIKLISSFGEETNVILESSGIPTIAIGRGGENFEIMLPRAIKADVGERIITLGKQPMLIGIVEKIEHQEADPFQKLIFRLPVNIQYLSHVFLLSR